MAPFGQINACGEKIKEIRRRSKDFGTVSHDNELSPGDDEIKKNSVSSVSSVAKINCMAAPHDASLALRP